MAGFLPVALADDHGNIQPHQWANIENRGAVRADNADRLPFTAQRHRDLPHAIVARACKGVYFVEQGHFIGETGTVERVFGHIKRAARHIRGLRPCALMTGQYRSEAVGGALQRGR